MWNMGKEVKMTTWSQLASIQWSCSYHVMDRVSSDISNQYHISNQIHIHIENQSQHSADIQSKAKLPKMQEVSDQITQFNRPPDTPSEPFLNIKTAKKP